ncbi:MAG: hypothetical protein JNL74_21850, partial [Fibrobacteres bacterium]|nr:hypothetical protein [Fibrobacterota bacterium]
MKKTLSILLLSVMSTALFAEYTTYDDLIKIVDSLTSLKPEIIVKKSFGVTTGGRELFAVKISDNASVNEYEPEIGFDAGTHGNEVVAQEMVYRFMRELVRSYDSDTLVKRYVDSREIWIFPLISPDGRMELNRLTHGVNLNRDWGFYWSPEFLGESPFELVETRAAARWVLDNRFVIHQTNHDGAALFAYHWGFAQKKSADSTHFTLLGNRFESFSPYIQVGFYTSGNVGTGSMFSYGVMGTMGFTMEVHGTINPPYSDSIVNLRWSTQRGSMYEMLNCAGTGIKGYVKDASTQKPLQATVHVRQIGAGVLRPSFTEPTNGDYHRFLAAGSY